MRKKMIANAGATNINAGYETGTSSYNGLS